MTILDLPALLAAMERSGLPAEAIAPVADAEDPAAYVQARGEELAALVPARYRELVEDARALGPKLRGARNRAQARERGVYGVWQALKALEAQREALHDVLLALRRAQAIPDQPVREAAIAKTMETHARRAGGSAW
jgi:hypothetical protein